MHKLGLDLGSSYCKGVVVDDQYQMVDSFSVKTGYSFDNAVNKIITKFSSDYELETPYHTCGYGREQLNIPYVSNSEIMALAKGVYQIYGRECSVIDIGGQDTKFIKINALGQVEKFKMNRKCAAGTGSFLEEIAFRLDISPQEFNAFAEQATDEVKINSFCTVFAVSEIIGMIKNGTSISNIIIGIYNSIVTRCIELSPVEDFLVITGGLPDTHPTIVKLFKNVFTNSDSPAHSQFLAAYGSVLLSK